MRENNAIKERLNNRVGLEQLWIEGEGISRLTPSGMLLQAIKMAWSSVCASPFTACMTLLTMVFSLFVFAAFLLFAENINRSMIGTQSEISMSVFLKDAIEEPQRLELEKLFADSGIIRTQNFIDKTQALDIFAQSVGVDSPLIEGIEGANPLPASYELTFRSVEDLDAQIEKLAAAVRAHPLVEHVDYSRGMVSAIVSALKTIQYLGSCAIIAMLFLSGFIIMVAIRLALYAHRDEIEIMYLVGAKRTFVRSPYMIEGLAQGMVGALMSILLLYISYAPLRQSVSGPIASVLFAEPHFLSVSSVLLVITLGIFVGVLGSYAAVRRVSTITIGE